VRIASTCLPPDRSRSSRTWNWYIRSPVSFDDPSTWTGALELGKPFRHEGLLGTVYTGNLLAEVEIGGRPGVVPTIGGQAWISGFSTHVLDPTDPFTNGFTVGDLCA
jgi:proline racemase